MPRYSYAIRVVLAAFLLVSLNVLSIAGGPVFWEISKQEDIAKGDATGVSIAENGAITLAPDFGLVYDTKEAYIWASATDAAGNVYLGTGHEGRIFVVDPKGAGRMLYDSGELDVTALATDPQGNVYAGTSPDGKIYKVTPDGRASVFCDPEDKYIWSLVYVAAETSLYAGTGNTGVIYRIDSAGKATVVVDTNETNIVSLTATDSGELLAGTDPSGLVLRVSGSGKTFALFDSPMQEIHSLSLASNGTLFALGISGQTSAQRQNTSAAASATMTTEGVITISTGDQDEPGVLQSAPAVNLLATLGQTKTTARNLTEGVKSAVFRISPDGSHDVFWSSREAIAFGQKLLPDGRLLVGTGYKGRIYSVAADRSPTLLVQSPEDQTSTIIAAGDKILATSSNLGRLYRISDRRVGEGRYVSPVRDAKFVAQWGVINWRSIGNAELQTRTGNTESPDSTWSDWSNPYRESAGAAITSPKARFIQWRATLRSSENRGGNQTGSPSQLQSVVVSYLPRNQAPDVTSVVVLPPGVALQETPMIVDPSISSSGLDPQLFGLTASVPPRRFYQKGARTLVWQAGDPNDDNLVFKLFYRNINDDTWHPLVNELAQTYYTIDANRLPDGAYLFKVQASDSLSNPKPLALTQEAVTEVVEIDNTPPVISTSAPVVTGLSAEVVFNVSDSTSRIIRAEYSIDGGAWELVFPIDGIADAARESFKVKGTFQQAGEHVVAFRCADSSSNVGASKITLFVR